MLKIFYCVYSNSKDASYLFSVKKDSNLKTSCHVKTKTFLWTKLLENLLLAECLISTCPCYGCSFVAKLAKLNWKTIFFFWKNICFLQNIHYLQKKIFHMEKSFIFKIFFTKKNFLFREKYIWKYRKYISHLKNIYLCR